MKPEIELHKVMREIELHGIMCTVKRIVKDSYGEDTEESITVYDDLKVLFHMSKGYLTKSVTDGTISHSKGQPMILTSFDDAERILAKDVVVIDSKEYIVVGKNNVQLLHVLSDISLEEVL